MRALPFVLALGCYEAQLDELDVRSARLTTQLEEATEMLEELEKGVERAERHLISRPRPKNFPEGFDAQRPLPAGHPTQPDVMVLSIDTLRADHLGSWGYERNTSPFLDQLANEGTRFHDAWSPAPWTLPTHSTMLSGLLPNHHGAFEDHIQMSPDTPVLPEVFREAGYNTAGVVATMFVSSKYGFERGFDYFQDFGVMDKKTNNLSTVDAEHVFSHALHWAQSQPAETPLFTFLHVYDVHYGYNAPSPWNERFDRAPAIGDAIYRSYFDYLQRMIPDAQLNHQIAQYDEEIAYVDHAFRGLVTQWRDSGRDLIVVVTSDHGEEFGERGSWGHAHTLFREQLHVPWIVHGPGVKRQVVRERVGLEDLAPTVAQLVGVDFETADGRDRSATVRGGRRLAGETGAYAATSRFETLSYRWHEAPYDLIVDMKRATRVLCDVERDPMCKTNLATMKRATSNAMFANLHQHLGQPWTPTEDIEVTLPKGVLLYEGTKRHKQTHTVKSGQAFAIHPLDGFFMARPVDEADSDTQDRYRALGQSCLHPPESLIRYQGDFICGSDAVTLNEADRALLEQLGYIQDEE